MRITQLVQDNRGVALIVTILAVSLIVALTLQFNRNMRSHVVSASMIEGGLQALYAAKSGVSLGLALLHEDSREVDSLQDAWAMPESLAAFSAGSSVLFTGGRFDLQIEDESGKIQINMLPDNDKLEKVFRRLLTSEQFGLESEDIGIIVDSVMDWIDRADESDDLVRFYGAEDDYYQSLPEPYKCKNGPIDSPEELLLVKGISKELFYGTNEALGIRSYITTAKDDGKININTASLLVLSALHDDMNQELAEEMVNYRISQDELALKDPAWYHEAGVPKSVVFPKEIVKTTSACFRVASTGYFRGTTRRIEAMVERGDKEISYLSWFVE